MNKKILPLAATMLIAALILGLVNVVYDNMTAKKKQAEVLEAYKGAEPFAVADAYLEALHDKDVQVLKALSYGTPSFDFREVNREYPWEIVEHKMLEKDTQQKKEYYSNNQIPYKDVLVFSFRPVYKNQEGDFVESPEFLYAMELIQQEENWKVVSVYPNT